MLYHAGALADYGGFFDHDREQKLAEATDRSYAAQALLDSAGFTYVVKGMLNKAKIQGYLAGCDGSSRSDACKAAYPRIFYGDPEESGYNPQPGVNNGDLAWLKTKVAELLDEEDEEVLHPSFGIVPDAFFGLPPAAFFCLSPRQGFFYGSPCGHRRSIARSTIGAVTQVTIKIKVVAA